MGLKTDVCLGGLVCVGVGMAGFALWQNQKNEKVEQAQAAAEAEQTEAMNLAAKDRQALLVQISQGLAEADKAQALVSAQIANLQKTTGLLEEKLGRVARDVAKGGSAKIPFDQYPPTLTFTDPVYLQAYHFVLVPGDASKGIDPLYVSVIETTWDQFRTWGLSEDLSDDEWKQKELINLRPSRPSYHDSTHKMGIGKKPAIAMSQLSAKQFAAFLSSETGLFLRLPTEAEWDHVYETTQGPLDQVPDNVNDIALNDDNGDFETAEVGSLEPNAYGIYDLLGNVSEWVTDSPDGIQVVRGGSYDYAAADLTGDLREVALMEEWNETYPQLPKSQWWFIDHVDHGFRLVCDLTPAAFEKAQASQSE